MLLKTPLLLLTFFLCSTSLLLAQKITKKPATESAAYKEYKKQFTYTDDPAPVKWIKPYVDTNRYVPKHYYISEINDSTGSRDSIGFTLQPKSGKKQPLAFEGGIKTAFTNYLGQKLLKDTTLYPIIMNIRKFEVVETREKPYDNATISYQYEFLYLYKNKPEKVSSYSGKGYLMTPIGMKKKYDSLLNVYFEKQFIFIDEFMEEGIEKAPMFCKDVTLTINLRREEGDPANDTLFYDKDRDLTWADFKGGSNGADNTFGAYTGISFDVDDIEYANKKYHITINLGADFIKSSSWIGKRIKEQGILYHMRYRLKLAGLYAYKLKKALEEARFTCDNFNAELRNHYTAIYKQLKVETDKFDTETEYGESKKAELRWEESIEKQLEEFEMIKQ